MKELKIKLMELEEEEKSLNLKQDDLRQEIAYLKDKEENSLEKEMLYAKNKMELQQVLKEKEILNNALDILNGIGV